jgi:hypothetical protein
VLLVLRPQDPRRRHDHHEEDDTARRHRDDDPAMNQNADSLRAGRLILAVADRDLPLVVKIMHETMTEPAGIIGLTVAISSVAIESARMVAGDDWRSVMVTALNTIEIEGISGDDQDDGDQDQA